MIENENIAIYENKPYLNQTLRKLMGREKLKDGERIIDELMGMQ